MARQNSRHISLNVNLAVPQTTLQLPDGSHTPNTPEILNSIVSMQTTPFSGFQQPIAPGNINKDYAEAEGTPKEAVEPSVSECVSQSSPSVEHYKSQFIKEGLKIKLSKQRGRAGHAGNSGSPYPSGQIEDSSMACLQTPSSSRTKIEDLTDEDKQRRLRKRERNKVAASKCRDKKKYQTQLLFSESESLILTNGSLKSEIQRLEQEMQQLMDILKHHEPLCAKRPRTVQPPPYQGHFNDPNSSTDSGTGNMPYSTDMFDVSNLPMIKVELASPSEEEIFPPSQLEPFRDPPSFANIHVDPENHFLGMRPASSPFHRNSNFHNSDTHCIAL